MTSPQKSSFSTPLPPLVTPCHLCLNNTSEVTSPFGLASPHILICTYLSTTNPKYTWIEIPMNCSILHHQAKYLPTSNSIANFALILEGSLHIDLKTMVILKLNVIGVMSPLVKTGYLPLVTSRHLLGDPPSLPLWGDVIYGWPLIWFYNLKL